MLEKSIEHATQTEKMLIDYSNYTTPIEKEKDSAFDFSIDQAQRLLGKGVEVAGKFTGIEGMEQFGADVVAQNNVYNYTNGNGNGNGNGSFEKYEKIL